MSILLLNDKNEDKLLLKRKVKNKTELAITDSTSNLPLGKALNLLVHIHSRVFDKAIATIRESSPSELTVHIIESPTIRAIFSIENYLTSSNDVSRSFKHVYDSLEEKFIKRSKNNSNNEQAMRVIGYFVLYSKYQKDVQQSICQELCSSEKRSQLAAVVLVQFLFTNYISTEDIYCDVAALFIPPLVKISEKYGNTPTLLACSSCDLALQFSRYIALHLNCVTESTSKIIEVQETNNNLVSIRQMKESRERVDILFYIIEKWHKSADQLEIASFKELHLLLRYTDKSLNHKDKQAEIIAVWDLITTWLSPKLVVSDKPLSSNKQKSILLFKNGENMSLLSSVKIIILVILQKGHLVKLYGPNRLSAVCTTEEEDIKNLIQKEYKTMVQLYPVGNIGNHLILQLVTQLSFLCTTNDIDSTELIQQIVSNVDYEKETTAWLLPLLMKQPESSICNLLWHVLEQDDKSSSSFVLLEDLIAQGSSAIIEVLENNLLPVAKNSDKVCELLIQCMDYIHLPTLIQNLMPLITTNDQREKMVYIALISKALLHHQWASNSILFLIDLVREFQSLKRFRTHIKPNFADLKKLTPHSITRQKQSLVESPTGYSDEELKEISTYLLAPIQLWSTKIDVNLLQSTLNQLVHKTYGLPGDNVCIDAWRNLSHAFMSNYDLIWGVMQQCVYIMKSHTMTDVVVNELKRVTPMLILQTIPKKSFEIVKLPKSYVDLVSNKFETLSIDTQAIKISSVTGTHTDVSIRLMDELLIRCFHEAWKPLQIFPVTLISKIFCD